MLMLLEMLKTYLVLNSKKQYLFIAFFLGDAKQIIRKLQKAYSFN